MSLRFLSTVATLAVAASFGFPTAASAQVPIEDSAVGSGSTTDPGNSFSNIQLDARSDPSGANPRGRVSFLLFNTFTVAGPVTCLAVTGNRAVIGFRDEVGGFGDIIVLAIDNGPPPPDEFFAQPAGGPVNCAAPSFLPDVGGQLAGDIVVIDAPALPTSKDQCKNGGWQSFGIFKNQGDCVSFVATGGKNLPANTP
jgi:hypothetical protein